MSETLSAEELSALVQRVFKPQDTDQDLAVLVDLPDQEVPDTPGWKDRREMAADWVNKLMSLEDRLGFRTHLVLYRNPRMNNADLPHAAWLHQDGELPNSADLLDSEATTPFADIFRSHSMLLAPTQFSATAPLKLNAKEYGFRAATMPSFSIEMIPALKLDYEEINRRVSFMKDLLDRAQDAYLVFRVDHEHEHRLRLDLRHRYGHASGGLFPEPGMAGNLPSGEAYIVPYEGEKPGQPSRSEGELPVQFGQEMVVFSVTNNRAMQAKGEGQAARQQSELLSREPAYGNLAELGLGVLTDFGIQPSGAILLDEKLGLHIAFGRSDHFGGQVGAAQFSKPEAVVHVDRVYISMIQPRVEVAQADLQMEDGERLTLMRDGQYVVDLP